MLFMHPCSYSKIILRIHCLKLVIFSVPKQAIMLLQVLRIFSLLKSVVGSLLMLEWRTSRIWRLWHCWIYLKMLIWQTKPWNWSLVLFFHAQISLLLFYSLFKTHAYLVYRPDCFGQLERVKLSGVQRWSQTPEWPAEPAFTVSRLHPSYGHRDEEAPSNNAAKSDQHAATARVAFHFVPAVNNHQVRAGCSVNKYLGIAGIEGRHI